MTTPPARYQWQPGYQALIDYPPCPAIHGQKCILEFADPYDLPGWAVLCANGVATTVAEEWLKLAY